MAILSEICSLTQIAIINSIAMKCTTLTLLCCLLAMPIFAQTQQDTSTRDLEREMAGVRQRMQEMLQKLSRDFSLFPEPDWKMDTTFSFHLDTIFGNGGSGFDQRFFTLPFGLDESEFQEFYNMIPSPDRDVPFGEQFKWFFPQSPGALGNEENSALEDQGDGLLPEERLRNEPGKETAPTEKKPGEETKKPKIKTIRI
jgi:hypothetical protein